MNLLIPGVAGFIGARTAQLALDAGHEVVGLDNLNDYYDPLLKHHRLEQLFKSSGFRFLEMDIENDADLDRAIATLRASENNVAVFGQLAAERAARQQSVDAQFKAGAVDRLEVLGAKVEMIAAQLTRLDAQAQAQQAFGALEDALQSPLPGPSVIEAAPRAQTPSPKP